ncbi:putative inositol phospholipid biosynthesis protein Scs3 [Aspergillus candidus]|uniref:Acyl-coenzyme A diphosphatase SCS3 n=1 Tax=Aspergillus candidus TaxID=41067 RepID=A0A2I2FN20_ASPCN|nr:inositol phospholipid synthesis and fat-storage-inducing TM-domain-containing protein [Aspergillus candidus]PLB42011.1 inositol phospholipid synthesis and fat-storage-inducing TM-domain-containing protein [Aspergillus candidus]
MATSTRPPPPTSPTQQQQKQIPAYLLLAYPATLLLGSLFSVLSPTAAGSRDNTPSAMHTAGVAGPHKPPPPVNYFARKDNIFNAYFVKIGWLWMTAAFASLVVSQPAYTTAVTAAQRPRRIAQAVGRYALATLAWYLTTQWCFGPAVIDRGFVITGGGCGGGSSSISDADGLTALVTAAACKGAGGRWSGGHDVSGHVFMLVLVTGVLGFEGVGARVGNGVSSGGEEEKEVGKKEDQEVVRKWAGRFVGVVFGLSWWMLLMTAIWFHTWLEKWNGLFLALATIYSIYILPRRVGAWRDVVGVPGV